MKKHIITFLQLFPVILSLLVLAAHFSRADNTYFIVVVFILILALFIPKPITARIIQVSLVLGALEWVRTLLSLAAIRMENDQPWIRLALILGLVSLFTLASALVFFSEALKRRYGLIKGPENKTENN